jgi:hypothetical protein
MPLGRSIPILFLVLSLAGCERSAAIAGERAEWREDFPTFTRHQIDDFRSGYQAIVLDVDGDGLDDIVALSTGASRIVWYRNPTWEPYEIVTGGARFINMAAHDVDGDGRVDLALASEFALNESTTGGLVHWARAPADPVATREWSLHAIDAVPTSHRLAWADLDGSGRKQLVNLPIVGFGASAPEYAGPVELRAYAIPADPTGPWQVRVLDDSLLEVAHGLEIVDWDGDGVDDILTASSTGITLFRPGRSGADRVTRIGEGHDGPRPNRGSSEVVVGTLGNSGRFLAVIEPWHGNEVVIYTPTPSGSLPWHRDVIDTELEGGHGIAVADLNGDGYDEVIAGGRSGSRSLFIYRYRPDSAGWERIPLDLGGVAVSSVDVGDLTGNGAPDILVIGSATNNVVWYENSGVR